MLDQESSIRAWRGQFEASGHLLAGELDELEDHLRCELDALDEMGFIGEEAFRIADERLGESRALGAEFAKFHPLLAWRTALYWATLGTFTVIVGAPVFFSAWREAVIALACELHVRPLSARVLGWVGTFAPIAFFAIAFAVARASQRAERRPLLGTRIARAALLVVAATTALNLSAVFYPTWFYRSLGERFPLFWGRFAAGRWHGEPALRVARDAFDDALFPMAAVVILGLGALAAHFRRRAASSRDEAPMFWLAIGCWVGTLAVSAFVVARAGVLAGAAIFALDGDATRIVMLAVTFAYPALLFAATYATLRTHLPSPDKVVGAKPLGTAIAIVGSAAVIAIAVSARVSAFAHAHAHGGAINGGLDAHYFATMMLAGAMPIVLGALMFRSRAAMLRT